MAIPRNLANIAPHVNASSTELVVNDGGANLDFRVEGDTDANTLFVDAGNDRVGVKTATPAVALDVVGQVRASTGILFGSDTAAANALDDYEEGTWTPTLRDGTTTTYTTQLGTYTKIGRLVYANFDITINSVGNGSVFVISGLPFTHGSSFVSGGAVYLFNSIATNAVFLTTYISNGESTIRIGQVSAAASSTSQGDVFQNGTNIRGFVLIIV